MSHIATATARILLLLGLAGCSTDRATAPNLYPETIGVSAGLTPRFVWGPGDAVYSITVTQGTSGPILWSALGQLQSNAIHSSVVYGSTPPGAIATGNPVLPLTKGRQYTVALARIAPDGNIVVVGRAGFTP